MSDIDKYKLLCDMLNKLKSVDISTTNQVSDIREIMNRINSIKNGLLLNSIELSEKDMKILESDVDNAISGNKIVNRDIITSTEIIMYQLNGSKDDVSLQFIPNSTIPPERGIIRQKLWKIKFEDNTTGCAIISDTSNKELSLLFNAQVSTALSTAPNGAVEDLNVTINLSDLQEIVLGNKSRNISNLINGLEKPGLVSRQLRDINIDTDPTLNSLSVGIKSKLKNAIFTLNNASTDEEIIRAESQLETIAKDAGLYSTSIGTFPNLNYSDLKRFKLGIDQNNITTVTLSMPIISWGDPIEGIPIRNSNGPKNKTNRKDDGTSYIVDLGGIDPVIRKGKPNPLPSTRFHNNGPSFATENEGALDRYKGGKSLGINTTDEEVSLQAVHKEIDGEITVIVPPMTALWKIDKASFDLGNRHAYYTVFSASRGPAAEFMGVVLAPKQNRLGRGRGEIASGVTLANGKSKTGKTFNEQDMNGAILDENNNEIPSNLKGVTSDFDGHGMDPVDILIFLENNSFIKGINYLTVPAGATSETVEYVLIPEGQFIPQITEALATLIQFANGKYVQDGGPNRFQAGLIPFMPGTPAYTPEWHINWLFYNAGNVECENNIYRVNNVALDKSPGSWIKPNHNASFGPPGPNSNNNKESGYSPLYPDTFDPVHLRCGLKGVHCVDYINQSKDVNNGEISLEMLPELEENNKIFLTEAPPGAMRGWVKFLVVNCPLPVVATINIVGEEINESNEFNEPNSTSDNCVTCTCDRSATNVSINGDLNPIWLENFVEDDKNHTVPIGTRTVKLKVGDNIVVKSTSGTMHGLSLRLDDMESGKTIDNKSLEVIQDEVLNEIKTKLIINNEDDIENNFIALSDDIISFHGGIPITFSKKSVLNPFNFPDGIVIADFLIKEDDQNISGKVAFTVHCTSMSFKFVVCP